MSVNLEYKYVSDLAFLPVLRVHEVVCPAPPPAADDLPAVIASQFPFLCQCHDPHQFVCLPAFIEEQLCFLDVYSALHSPSHIS